MGSGQMDTVEDVKISYNHPRLKKCFKTLIWFSEIFPKKYQNEFIDDIIANRNKKRCEKSKTQVLMTPKSALNARRERILWSDYYLIKAEEDFDQIFEDIYEEQFVDKLFPEHEALISMEFFKE